MGEDGEKTCPLCAEEMDFTDQQLKPCKCGYEICVWCWHHIMEMAEKDDTEGRCPACRNPYDKERIVGTTANCERLVSEINSERRLKSQKSKPKTSEGRKHLGSVRVIQRNLVYIIGIPSTLADEDALQRKEYFGQYGKVLKVSMSRTAGGAIQYSPNNTCSVYITYSKEEEAVRCIQSVHGYVLEDKPLRACFGTTKYCHAWLRNTPCNNPDCLYLHEVGIQEDSFSKDEIVSAFTRSRVQQITGATNNMMRRSGNVLPPPADEFLNNSTTSSEKPIARSVPNNPPSLVRGSPPNGTSGRSVTLPAASSWGLRASNGHSLTAISAGSDGPAKQNPTDATSFTDIAKKSLTSEETHAVHPNGKMRLLESSKKPIVKDFKIATPEEEVRDAFADNWPPVSKRNNPGISKIPNDANPVERNRKANKSAADQGGNVETGKISQSLCSGLSSMSISSDSQFDNSDDIRPKVSVSNHPSSISPGDQGLQQLYHENARKLFASVPGTSVASREMAEASDAWVSDSRKQVSSVAQFESEDVSQDFNGLSLRVSDAIGTPLYSPSSSKLLNSYGHSWQGDGTFSAGNHGYGYPPTSVHSKVNETLVPPTSIESVFSNGFYENNTSTFADLGRTFERSNLSSTVERPNLSSTVETGKALGSFSYDAANATKDDVKNWGESSIISDILSMDFDPWDTSLASPHNIARLLSKSDKEHVPKISSSLKVQNNNQSRFSFARHDDFGVQGTDLEPSSSNFGHMDRYPIHQDSAVNGDLYLDTRRNGFSSSILEESYSFPRNHSNISSVSRAQIAAPPGFSVPSRAPPPGFSSHERLDQNFVAASGNNYLDNSFLLRNHYQTQSTGNLGIEDVEFIDPAILAVGKGRLPNGINNSPLDMKSAYAPQLSASENDLRLQMLMQQSISAHQNLMFPDHIRDRFSPLTDAYNGIPSMHLEQPSFAQSSLQSRNAHLSNGHGWNGIQNGNDLGMAELLRSERLERLGFNNQFSGYEDLKYRIPSSGDLYSRAFGM